MNDMKSPPPKRTPGTLSERENAVLCCLREGFTDREIAKHIGISEKTVNFYVRQLSLKLEARNRTHAVVKALQRGLIALD